MNKKEIKDDFEDLFSAIENKDEELVKTIVLDHIKEKTINTLPFIAFYRVCQLNLKEIPCLMLENGFNIKKYVGDQRSDPLVQCARHGNLRAIQIASEKNYIKKFDNLIMQAIVNDKPDIVEYCLKNYDTRILADLVYQSIFNRSEDCLKLIITDAEKKNLIYKFIDDNNPSDILANITTYFSINMVKFAVEKGINSQHEKNEALVTASKDGKLDVVQYMLEIGADIYVDNNASLKMSCYKNHPEVVRYLLSKGAFLDKKIVTIACAEGGPELAKVLLDYGVKVGEIKKLGNNDMKKWLNSYTLKNKLEHKLNKPVERTNKNKI